MVCIRRSNEFTNTTFNSQVSLVASHIIQIDISFLWSYRDLLPLILTNFKKVKELSLVWEKTRRDHSWPVFEHNAESLQTFFVIHSLANFVNVFVNYKEKDTTKLAQLCQFGHPDKLYS